MKVYRYLTQAELDAFLAKDISIVGSEYDNSYRRVNTHRYKDGVNYLHFYMHQKDIRCAKAMHRDDRQDYYTCQFNIPVMTLLRHRGHGIYDIGGYDCDIYRAVEFAIPVDEIKAEYLTDYEYDKIHHEEANPLEGMKPFRFNPELYKE